MADTKTVAPQEGPGTRFGPLGKLFGGAFGTGGKERVEEAYKKLEKNFGDADEVIDIVGFSRGAALAAHFSNVITKKSGATRT